MKKAESTLKYSRKVNVFQIDLNNVSSLVFSHLLHVGAFDSYDCRNIFVVGYRDITRASFKVHSLAPEIWNNVLTGIRELSKFVYLRQIKIFFLKNEI